MSPRQPLPVLLLVLGHRGAATVATLPHHHGHLGQVGVAVELELELQAEGRTSRLAVELVLFYFKGTSSYIDLLELEFESN